MDCLCLFGQRHSVLSGQLSKRTKREKKKGEKVWPIKSKCDRMHNENSDIAVACMHCDTIREQQYQIHKSFRL